MRSRLLPLPLLLVATLPAQRKGDRPVALDVSISPAQLAFVDTPEMTLIDTQEELDAFQKRARVVPEGNPLRKYDKELQPMKVDFEAVRLVAICWGPHPFEREARLHLESARMIGETVRLAVRTSMVVGTPKPPGANMPKTVYPANLIAVPRTKKVVVQLTGARKQKDGFTTMRTDRLVVTVAPDSMPLRDKIELQRVQEYYNDDDSPPHVLVSPTAADDQQLVDISWCLFGSEHNTLQLDAIELRGDALHVGVVATRTIPAFYSGPGSNRPQLRFLAPMSKRVLVHIRRHGDPITAKDKLIDFQPFKKGNLEVTVEHHKPPKSAWRTGGLR